MIRAASSRVRSSPASLQYKVSSYPAAMPIALGRSRITPSTDSGRRSSASVLLTVPADIPVSSQISSSFWTLPSSSSCRQAIALSSADWSERCSLSMNDSR
ncbi:hypothetical protein D9M68_955680 [compost metagenome]